MGLRPPSGLQSGAPGHRPPEAGPGSWLHPQPEPACGFSVLCAAQAQRAGKGVPWASETPLGKPMQALAPASLRPCAAGFGVPHPWPRTRAEQVRRQLPVQPHRPPEKKRCRACPTVSAVSLGPQHLRGLAQRGPGSPGFRFPSSAAARWHLDRLLHLLKPQHPHPSMGILRMLVTRPDTQAGPSAVLPQPLP